MWKGLLFPNICSVMDQLYILAFVKCNLSLSSHRASNLYIHSVVTGFWQVSKYRCGDCKVWVAIRICQGYSAGGTIWGYSKGLTAKCSACIVPSVYPLSYSNFAVATETYIIQSVTRIWFLQCMQCKWIPFTLVNNQFLSILFFVIKWYTPPLKKGILNELTLH